jgi:hypothetical protein
MPLDLLEGPEACEAEAAPVKRRSSSSPSQLTPSKPLTRLPRFAKIFQCVLSFLSLHLVHSAPPAIQPQYLQKQVPKQRLLPTLSAYSKNAPQKYRAKKAPEDEKLQVQDTGSTWKKCPKPLLWSWVRLAPHGDCP